MGTTTTNMGLSKPTLAGDAATWDDQINASLDAIDLHNHTTGAGVQIPAGGLNLTTDLTLNGTCALTNAKALAFTTQASYTVSKSLWVKTSDGELYWRNASGTDVKMTSGGTLNVAIVGGIVGDYAAASAAVYYDDSAQAYRFLEAAPSPNSWSRVQCGDLDLYEHASGIANRVRIASPTGLAASYALTLPAALPGSTSILQVSSAGAITASNTIANAVAMSASLTVGTTLGVTGLITASAGLTASANQDVTISGTGRFKHGSIIRTVSPHAGQGSGYTLAAGYVQSTGANTYYLPIPFDVGERLTTVDTFTYGDGAMDLTIDVCLYSAPSGGSITRTVIGTASNTNQGATWGTNTINVTDTTLATGEQIVIEYQPNATNLRVGPAVATYDRP